MKRKSPANTDMTPANAFTTMSSMRKISAYTCSVEASISPAPQQIRIVEIV